MGENFLDSFEDEVSLDLVVHVIAGGSDDTGGVLLVLPRGEDDERQQHGLVLPSMRVVIADPSVPYVRHVHATADDVRRDVMERKVHALMVSTAYV